ncbi:MAG: hypothetical protein NT092_00775 [Bacteroidia bacterium]|nr:hypothetical protein [Bacteroidia bacterium]
MKLNKILIILFFILGFQATEILYSQAVPSKEENIPFLVTFGKQSGTSWGDDDFYQVWFFSVPRDFKQPFYIRVFDPDCGGEYDEIHGDFNTRTLFSIFGGKGVDPDQNEESKGLLNGDNYKRGTLLKSQYFKGEARYDNKYFSFGPFNPTEGDYNKKWNVFIFKLVCEGVSGDDGNLYKYFMSRDPNNNIPVEGGNAFTYEYTFRMWNDPRSLSHIYPYVDTGVVFVKQRNFDWDDDGEITISSRYKQGVPGRISKENDWNESRVRIEPEEIGASLDFMFRKKQGRPEDMVKNNNVVMTIENQYGQAMKFYSSPIGGVPKYEAKTNITKIPKPK